MISKAVNLFEEPDAENLHVRFREGRGEQSLRLLDHIKKGDCV
jgi:hypothetical protein